MPLVQIVKVTRLRSASNSSKQARKIVCLHLLIGQLHKNAAFLVMPCFAPYLYSGTVISSHYIEWISSKAKPITPLILSFVVIANATKDSQATTVENNEHQKPATVACAIARAVGLSKMSKTFVRVMASVERFRLMERHCALAGRAQTMVAQGIVNNSAQIFFRIVMTSLANLYTQLNKNMKIAECSKAQVPSFVSTADGRELYGINIVQVYKASKCNQKKLMDNKTRCRKIPLFGRNIERKMCR